MITDLPTELQFQMVSHFNSFQDFARFGCVCKKWHQMQQDDHFWKIVANKLGIPLSTHHDKRSWVIEYYQTTKRFFSLMSRSDFPLSVLQEPAMRRHFRSLARCSPEDLHVFQQVFQITGVYHLQKRMMQDLIENVAPPAILRLNRSVIFSHFSHQQALCLNGSIEVHIEGLSLEECQYLKSNAPLFVKLYYILNNRLLEVNKAMCSISKVCLLKKFDLQTKSIQFKCPLFFHIFTRPVDLQISLFDFEQKLDVNPLFYLDISPYQRLFVIDIKDEKALFFTEDVRESLEALFRCHHLKLDCTGYLFFALEDDKAILYSDRAMRISKLPI